MTDQSPIGVGAEVGSDSSHEDASTQSRATTSEVAEAGVKAPLPAPRATVAGRVWVAIGFAVVLLVLLIVFIAENSRDVTVSFLGANGTLALGLALLIAAIAGAVITLLVGTTRILQLRREVRRRHSRTR